jgi:hypothetical protein
MEDRRTVRRAMTTVPQVASAALAAIARSGGDVFGRSGGRTGRRDRSEHRGVQLENAKIYLFPLSHVTTNLYIFRARESNELQVRDVKSG